MNKHPHGRPGEARRKALQRQMLSLDLELPCYFETEMKNNGKPLKIEKFYKAAKKLLDTFEAAYKKKELDLAYMLGKRYAQFSLEEIPRHLDYYSPKHERQRKRNAKDLERVFAVVKDISEIMDKEEEDKRRSALMLKKQSLRIQKEKLDEHRRRQSLSETIATKVATSNEVRRISSSGELPGLNKKNTTAVDSRNGTTNKMQPPPGNRRASDNGMTRQVSNRRVKQPHPRSLSLDNNSNHSQPGWHVKRPEVRKERQSSVDNISGSSHSRGGRGSNRGGDDSKLDRLSSHSNQRISMKTAPHNRRKSRDSGGGYHSDNNSDNSDDSLKIQSDRGGAKKYNIRNKLQKDMKNGTRTIHEEKSFKSADTDSINAAMHRAMKQANLGAGVCETTTTKSPERQPQQKGNNGVNLTRVPHLDDPVFRADKSKRLPPKDEATIIFTDIQGSTALWESNPNAMEDALRTHDEIMRRCCAQAHGYEITTEGDAFQLAFHDPVDAISFCLQVQMDLYAAPWSDALLRNPHACVDGVGRFRGVRVRMGMHHGPVTSKLHEITGHTRYSGQTVMIAKQIEEMCHGGQILMTIDTYRLAASALVQSLDSPQVLDLGEHFLLTDKGTGEDIVKFVVQFVPKPLSYDYFSARRSEGSYGNDPSPGRLFDSPISKKQTKSSFLDAPYKNGLVTIAFVYSPGLKGLTDEIKDKTFMMLWKLLRSLLELGSGYECQEDRGAWMLAFDNRENAVKFGLALLNALSTYAYFDSSVNRSELVKIGIHSGHYTSMGPHAITGRADYFGTVVNRTARVAGVADSGQLVVGIMGTGQSKPSMGRGVEATFIGTKRLKGVNGDMALFSCRWKR